MIDAARCTLHAARCTLRERYTLIPLDYCFAMLCLVEIQKKNAIQSQPHHQACGVHCSRWLAAGHQGLRTALGCAVCELMLCTFVKAISKLLAGGIGPGVSLAA